MLSRLIRSLKFRLSLVKNAPSNDVFVLTCLALLYDAIFAITMIIKPQPILETLTHFLTIGRLLQIAIPPLPTDVSKLDAIGLLVNNLGYFYMCMTPCLIVVLQIIAVTVLWSCLTKSDTAFYRHAIAWGWTKRYAIPRHAFPRKFVPAVPHYDFRPSPAVQLSRLRQGLQDRRRPPETTRL